MDVGKLIQTMQEYAPGAHQIMEAMATALRPVALILIAIFFLIEVTDRTAELKLDGGALTPRVLGEIVFYYFVAFILVWQSQVILDAILWTGNTLVKLADRVVPVKTVEVVVETGKVKGFLIKDVVKFIAYITQYVATVITQILMMMRYYQMYIANAIAPVMVAFFVNRHLRSIAINFLKLFGSYALQGLVMVIIIVLYPHIVNSDVLKLNDTGTLGGLQVAFGSIAQGIIYIMILVGSNRYIKQLMGVS